MRILGAREMTADERTEYEQCEDGTRGMITGPDLWGSSAERCHYVFADIDCDISAVVYQQS